MTIDPATMTAPATVAPTATPTEDRLPRRIEASFFEEGGAFRHVVDLSDWQLDLQTSPGDFTSAKAQAAGRIPFAPPGTN